MLTPTLSGTIMRRQHGARRRTREDPEKISRLCMLLLNYRIYHAWRLCIACTISRGVGESWGGCCDNNLSKYCRLIKTRSKQIVDRWRLPLRGYTTLKCTFASNTHSFRQSCSHSFTHSLAHSICFEACDNKSSLSLSALQFPARIKVKLIERSTR